LLKATGGNCWSTSKVISRALLEWSPIGVQTKVRPIRTYRDIWSKRRKMPRCLLKPFIWHTGPHNISSRLSAFHYKLIALAVIEEFMTKTRIIGKRHNARRPPKPQLKFKLSSTKLNPVSAKLNGHLRIKVRTDPLSKGVAKPM
jgi:hypothetical protein